MATDKITTDEYFGGCPKCGESDGHLNVGRNHWAVCDTHKTTWPIGENLFSGWHDETEADWQRNEEKLAGYRQVEPIHYEPTEEEWREMEGYNALIRRTDKGYGVAFEPGRPPRAIEPGEDIFAGFGE